LRLLKHVVNEAAGVAFFTHHELSEQLFSHLGYIENFLSRERGWVSPETLEAAQNFGQQGRRERDD
jgi:hypothetical protein